MILLDELLNAGGRLTQRGHTRCFAGFSYDSRLTQPGELFLALRTPRADGHDYIPAALAAGAAGVVCAHPISPGDDKAVILSDNPEILAQRWAAQRLRQVNPTVVAVTGSVGKTSTKHAIAALLSALAPTFESRQSFNSLLGVPVTLAQLEENHHFAVLEFGTGHFGEMRQLAALFPPDIAVVTAVGHGAHMDAFETPAGVAREKSDLVEALPADGWAILNGDDPYVLAMREQTPARVLTFGRQSGCHLWASVVHYSLQGTHMRLHWQGVEGIAAPADVIEVMLPLVGEAAVTVALAAVGAALACGVPLAEAGALLAQVTPLPGRFCPLPTQSGAVLLDDTFNAAMPSVLAALHTLRNLPARRRIVLLGELNDLGSQRDAACREIGTLVGQVADLLICKGEWSQQVIEAAREVWAAQQVTRRAVVVHTAAAVLQALPADLGADDLILVKGSPEARMERVSAGLLAPSVSAAHTLVRQEPGWSHVRIGMPDRPTWIRIDLDALAHNIRSLRAIAGVPVMAVLKADAYGHGALRVARTALANGAEVLAVATLGEARALREADIIAPVIILGYTPPWQMREAVALGVTCTVFDLDAARACSDAALALHRPAAVHVKLDTGMGRLGLRPEEVGTFLHELAQLPGLRVEGLYTHFATADSADETFARLQLARLRETLAAVEAAGLRPPLIHAANSAALLRFPEARYDMVRPGIACYGLAPDAATPLSDHFQPVLSFHTEVAQVKTVPASTPLSYGCTFVTQRPSRIATIPVGYADGLRRSPPWQMVLLRGRRVPIVGRICMDYAMLDVTGMDEVKRGDAVTLIGGQGDDAITADEVAGWLGTINYEVISTLLPRVPREVEP